MSEFRVFCIGALVGNLMIGLVSFVVGAPSSLTPTFYMMAICGALAVTFFGRTAK